MNGPRIFKDEDGTLRYQPEAPKPAKQSPWAQMTDPPYLHIWLILKGIKRWCGLVLDLGPYQVDARIELDVMAAHGVKAFRSEVVFDAGGRVTSYELHPVEGA